MKKDKFNKPSEEELKLVIGGVSYASELEQCVKQQEKNIEAQESQNQVENANKIIQECNQKIKPYDGNISSIEKQKYRN